MVCGCVRECMCVCTCGCMCEWVGVVVGEERVVLIAGYNYTTVHIHNSRSVAEGP